MALHLYRKEELPELEKHPARAAEKEYLSGMLRNGVQHYIENVATTFYVLAYEHGLLPLTVKEREYESAWVCSNYSALVGCTKESLRLPPHQRILALGLCDLFGLMLKLASCNRSVQVNNWLMGTNLYPPFERPLLNDLTNFLITRFPQHIFVFRSLGHQVPAPPTSWFDELGYLLVPTMKAHIFDGRTNLYERRNNREDRAFLKRSSYRQINPLEASHFADCARLYSQLYVPKSRYNPIFHQRFFELCAHSGLVQISGLISSEGRLDGMIGCLERGQAMTSPFIGYDDCLPQNLGIYRSLMQINISHAQENRMIYHCGSGVSGFKTLRGASTVIEPAAIYWRHLPKPRRVGWQVLTKLLQRWGEPVLAMIDS